MREPAIARHRFVLSIGPLLGLPGAADWNWTAVGAVVQAIATIVLICVTVAYLRHVRRRTSAAERAAAAAERAAHAAYKLATHRGSVASRSEDRKPCPLCGEEISPVAIVCHHCGRDVRDPGAGRDPGVGRDPGAGREDAEAGSDDAWMRRGAERHGARRPGRKEYT